MDARRFLKENGLADLIEIVVESNKFETVKDLIMLANNSKFMDSITQKIPLCWHIKFEAAIKKLDHVHDTDQVHEDPVHVHVVENAVIPNLPLVDKANENKGNTMNDISKKTLTALAKNDLTAQAVNIKYNELNKVLLAELRRRDEEWKGAKAFKRCESTDTEDAKENMKIADEIVDSPAVRVFYGSFTIGNHGTFTINRAKAKLMLARKLAVERKPSAYKRKAKEIPGNDDVDANASKRAKESPVAKKDSRKSSDEEAAGLRRAKERPVARKDDQKGSDEEDADSVNDFEQDMLRVSSASNENSSEEELEPTIDKCTKRPATSKKGRKSKKDDLQNTRKSMEMSEYEVKRNKEIELNNLEMLKKDLVPNPMAVIITLFYLKAKKVADLNMITLRKTVNQVGLPSLKTGYKYSKENLAVLIGKELYTKRKVKRIDENKVVTKDNLTITEERS